MCVYVDGRRMVGLVVYGKGREGKEKRMSMCLGVVYARNRKEREDEASVLDS